MAEPNAGLPELRGNETVFPLGPEDFAQKTAPFAHLGARILGGCCGTTPAHLAALAQVLRGMDSVTPPPVSRKGICLTNRSQMVRIAVGQPLTIIGERINPTGKKALTLELQAGAFEVAMSKANDIKVKELKPVFTPEQIAARIQELAAEINAEYGDEPMVAVCVLKGGFMFFSDLVRFLHNKNLELDFVRLSSYGKGSSSSKHGYGACCPRDNW